LETDRWRARAAFQNLASKRREDLEEGVAELLLVLARLEARQDRLDPAPEPSPNRIWRFEWRTGPGDKLDPAELAARYRRALSALQRIETFRAPSPAVSLWMAEFQKALGEEVKARDLEAKASSLRAATSLDHFAMGEHHAVRQEWDAALARIIHKPRIAGA